MGGASIGLLAAVGALGIGALDLSITARCTIAFALAVGTAAVDLGAFGIELPIFKRQVNDAWLRRYRGWAYGAGFGWQIGFGVATYIMTAGILLMVGLAVLTASPFQALLIGTTFGIVRGSAVFVGRSATSPAALGQIHATLERYAPVSRAAAALVQVVAASALVLCGPAGPARTVLAASLVPAALAVGWLRSRSTVRQAHT